MHNPTIKIFLIIVSFARISLATTRIQAQDNGSFEDGLRGWTTTGIVQIDSTNAQQGQRCAVLSKKSGVALTMHTDQLSIIQSHIFVKCMNGARAYYRTSFLDANGKELMR